jgi:acetoacetyl-CoA reductase
MIAALKINDQPQEPSAASENIAGVSFSNPVRRTVLVTGGTSGVGSAICKRMADMGHFVATTYRNEEKARAWQDRMESEGYLFYIYECDVSNFEESRDLVSDVLEDLGPIQILVNNTGITRDSSLRKMTAEQWQDVISNDLGSIFNVTRAAIDGMLATGFGRIVNISSINGQKGQFGQASFSAAKAGMHGFTKALAQEVAKKGVTVNTISPGYVATDMILSMPENIRSSIIAQIPVGRLGKPEDVAHVVSFLVSEDSGFITGANIAANGGHFID